MLTVRLAVLDLDLDLGREVLLAALLFGVMRPPTTLALTFTPNCDGIYLQNRQFKHRITQ